MNITIKLKNIDLTPPLKEYIEDKVGSLEHYLKRMNTDTLVARVDLSRDAHHNKGEVYQAEVSLDLPGGGLRAEATDFDARVAIDAVRDKLRREIEKYLDSHGREHRRNPEEE